MALPRAILFVAVAAVGCALVAAVRAQQAERPGGGALRFSVSSDLVLLHVNVHDRSGKPVPGLPQHAFTVAEDGRRQPIAVFSGEDAPVTVGLVMDASMSVWPIRDLVIAGAMAFVQAGNPEDERFGITFNDEVRAVLPPETPFTSDIPVLRAAVGRALVGVGRTALFDAIAMGLDYCARGAHARKTLVVISDGGDNASHVTLDDIVKRAQASNVVIYAVAVVDPAMADTKPGVLRRLAAASGGEIFTPATAAEVDGVFRTIAREIRESYTVGYVPERPADNTFRTVRVTVASGDGRRLTVRTRAGYLASTSGNVQ